MNPVTPIAIAYQAEITAGRLKPDPAQIEIMHALEYLQTKLLASRKSRWPFFISKNFAPKNFSHLAMRGAYIYGEVGRGKSMLMDLFFATTEISKKRRVHFHEFMLEVHARLFELRKSFSGDPLVPLAEQIAEASTLLCFDEFQVSDIADAMILSRLFEKLFNEGIIMVATSNRAPDMLYWQGLQRERFLPFITLLERTLQVLHLAGPDDYRLKKMQNMAKIYITPLGAQAHDLMAQSFAHFTNNATPHAVTLEMQGRKLTLEKCVGDVAWAEFSELCIKELGSADYLELSLRFNMLFLSNIPKFTRDNRNEAKRFTTLIDELYEHKVKLIASAEVPPQELYMQGDGSFEFERTASRLIEMQSEPYWKLAHIINNATH